MKSIVSVRDDAGNEIGRLEAESAAMDYPAMPWRADPCIGRASDGTLFAGVHSRIFESADEGRTWTSFTVAFDGFERMNNFGVLPDDTFLMLYETPPDDLGVRGMAVACSTDRGEDVGPRHAAGQDPLHRSAGCRRKQVLCAAGRHGHRRDHPPQRRRRARPRRLRASAGAARHIRLHLPVD